MNNSFTLGRDIKDALDQLRDATVNGDYSRSTRLKRILLELLEPAGYTLAEDPKEIYVIRAIENKG